MVEILLHSISLNHRLDSQAKLICGSMTEINYIRINIIQTIETNTFGNYVVPFCL
jgi:hypothetical protein